MSTALLKTLLKAGIYYGVSELLLRGEDGRRRLRKVAGGALLLALTAGAALFAIIVLVFSLFFFLADLHDFARSAFITALVLLAVTALLGTEAYRLFSFSAKH